MIVLDSFPPVAEGSEGRVVHIDDDRRITAFTGDAGSVRIEVHNGSMRQAMALTREAAEALCFLLIDVLEPKP